MIQARVNTGQLNETAERIGVAAEKIQEGLATAVAEWLRLVIRTSFQNQASAEEIPWAPLSPAYSRRKRGPGILRESGALFEQSTRAPEITRISPEQTLITAGSTLPYAPVHQFGSEGEVGVHEFMRRVITGKDRWGRLLNPRLGKQTRQIIARGVRFDKIAKHTRHMRMPARPYLPSPEFVTAEGTKIAQEFVDGATAEAGAV
ncbi:MAG: phage virion morphogenesis protein [Candidatus Acidiferrales bacterium]